MFLLLHNSNWNSPKIPNRMEDTYSWSRLCLNVSLYRSRKFLRMSTVSFSCRLFDSSAGNKRAVSAKWNQITHCFYIISSNFLTNIKRLIHWKFKKENYPQRIKPLWLCHFCQPFLYIFFESSKSFFLALIAQKEKTFPIKFFITVQTIQSSVAPTFEPPSEGHISLEKHRHLDNYGMKINSDSDWKPSINFYFWLNRFQTKK